MEQEPSRKLASSSPLCLPHTQNEVLLVLTSFCGCAHVQKSLLEVLHNFTERMDHSHFCTPIHLRHITWRVQVRTSHHLSSTSTPAWPMVEPRHGFQSHIPLHLAWCMGSSLSLPVSLHARNVLSPLGSLVPTVGGRLRGTKRPSGTPIGAQFNGLNP